MQFSDGSLGTLKEKTQKLKQKKAIQVHLGVLLKRNTIKEDKIVPLKPQRQHDRVPTCEQDTAITGQGEGKWAPKVQ